MKKIIILTVAVLIAISLSSFGQHKKAKISFDKKIHQFGNIKEASGVVNCKFEFTNIGSEPLTISNVQGSGGCKSTNWTKTSVVPGKKGFVYVQYNPLRKSGKFNNTITVSSNSENPTTILQIQGIVTPKPKTITDEFRNQMANGDLRLKTNYLVLGKISNKNTKTDSILVLNSSKDNIKLTFENVPKYITVKSVPSVIKPNKRALIVVTYNASLNKNAKGEQQWGNLNSRINVIINGNVENVRKNPITIRADIFEDFSHLTKKELARAPIIEFENTTYNYGKIKQGTVVKHDFVFKNLGKEDLVIRKVKAG